MAVNEVPVASYPSVVALHTTAEDAALDDSDMTPYMRYICETVPPNTVYSFALSGEDGKEGCPTCFCNGYFATNALEITAAEYSTAVPEGVRAVISETEWRQFVSDFNEASRNTNWPIYPCALGNFLLPFSPFICFIHFQSKRISAVESVIESANKRISSRGVHLYVLP